MRTTTSTLSQFPSYFLAYIRRIKKERTATALFREEINRIDETKTSRASLLRLFCRDQAPRAFRFVLFRFVLFCFVLFCFACARWERLKKTFFVIPEKGFFFSLGNSKRESDERNTNHMRAREKKKKNALTHSHPSKLAVFSTARMRAREERRERRDVFWSDDASAEEKNGSERFVGRDRK